MDAHMSRSLARIVVTRIARIVTCRDGREHGGRIPVQSSVAASRQNAATKRQRFLFTTTYPAEII